MSMPIPSPDFCLYGLQNTKLRLKMPMLSGHIIEITIEEETVMLGTNGARMIAAQLVKYADWIDSENGGKG